MRYNVSPSLVYFVLLLFIPDLVYSHIHDCTTPNSTVGTCLPLERCPKMQEMFKKITDENYEYLKLSQCGYADLSPEICCPTSKKRREFVFDPMKKERVPAMTLGNRFGKPSKDLPKPGECGVQTFDNRIFGGTITGIDEFPWMALLSYGKRNIHGYSFACGGALIHSRYVLTAAHCVTGPTETELGGLQFVRLGEHNINKELDCESGAPDDCAPPPIDVKIVRKIVHPQYKHNIPDQHHDIALLELEHDIEFNDFVRPICLAKTVMPGLFDKGKVHYVCGWGLTEKNVNSPIKLMTKLSIAEPQSCLSLYNTKFRINIGSNQVCVGGSGTTDSCRGDSGGPLMVPASVPGEGPIWFMTGLVSIGPTPCAARNIPGIYTRVSSYYDWIVSNMK